jgi:PHD/YefM family antitoxin component YafN of YafNO toxin-antitoxin module
MVLKISATKAKNQFGAICALAKQEPVLVEKDGRPDTVILSTSLYEEFLRNQQKSQGSEKEASKRFAKTHKEFIQFWTEETERHGSWSEKLRNW